MANDPALSAQIDVAALAEITQRIERNSAIIDEMVERFVAKYCQPLDEYMTFVRDLLNNQAHPPSNEELDDCVLKLPVLLYFMGEAQEAIGVKEDIAKAIKMELYNETYHKAAGTVGDKTARAELATQSEYVAHVIYQRAYKKIKLKQDMALETLQSMKKIISRRLQEFELGRIDTNRIPMNNKRG